ncbi:MAG TPA: hypothetical protein EYG31_03505 [Porticoccaceae bacterium]|jgi:hypothetical protein|nr:hypothetical protein [Gammaproteobacteria bacterium]HIL59687.1 hypothetical protein [Porticoccaceae bacterium]
MATTEKRTTKDGKTSYRCKIRRKGQSPLSATLNTKSDAERWCIQHESAILTGRHFNYVESRYRSLRDAIARYGEDILMQLADSSGRITHLAWWESQIGDCCFISRFLEFYLVVLYLLCKESDSDENEYGSPHIS